MFLMKKLKHKLIFIPLWLRKLQKVYGFDDKVLLSYLSLLDILSVEDVANYSAANQVFNNEDFFLPYSLTFNKNHIDETDKSLNETVSTRIHNLSINMAHMFNNNESYTNSMTSMIQALQFPLNEHNLDEDLHETIRDNYVFELSPIGEEHIGITFIYDDGSKTLNECLVQSIELLCKLYPFSVVAQTPLFNYWVSTLNKVT